jgi:hypothetical protein
MPIPAERLNERVNCHIRVLDTSTLMEAFAALKAANGQLWWHLVIEDQDKNWTALRFGDLDSLLFRLGPEAFTTPLRELPRETIPLMAVDRESTDAASIPDLLLRSGTRPLAVSEKGHLLGIICDRNNTRGEFFAGSMANELYGTLADLSADARVRYQAKAPPPTCPHCKHVSYQKYDLTKKTFVCRLCGK